VDCRILRSKCSPDFSKLRPSPTSVQQNFQMQSPSEASLFTTKLPPFVPWAQSKSGPDPNIWRDVYCPDPLQLQQNLLRFQSNLCPIECSSLLYTQQIMWTQYFPFFSPISNTKRFRQILALFYLHRLFHSPVIAWLESMTRLESHWE